MIPMTSNALNIWIETTGEIHKYIDTLVIFLIKTDPCEYRHPANPTNGNDNVLDRTGNQKE